MDLSHGGFVSKSTWLRALDSRLACRVPAARREGPRAGAKARGREMRGVCVCVCLRDACVGVGRSPGASRCTGACGRAGA